MYNRHQLVVREKSSSGFTCVRLQAWNGNRRNSLIHSVYNLCALVFPRRLFCIPQKYLTNPYADLRYIRSHYHTAENGVRETKLGAGSVL